jgi:nucleotide-binding universal stress UspA family protein
VTVRPSILCPIDFSEASVGALRYAAALADHFGARLIVLTVEDPLLTAAMELHTGVKWTPTVSRRQVSDFVSNACGDQRALLAPSEFEARIGKPPGEILQVAREHSCDLIVMSSHGQTGVRKLFFGTTTERVLRETTVPVLVTPPVDPGLIRMEDAPQRVGCIVAPLDLSPASASQARIAGRLAGALSLPLVLMHVLAPLPTRLVDGDALMEVDEKRRTAAREGLEGIGKAQAAGCRLETLVVAGDPAEEIATIVRDRHAGLIVIGLHGSPFLGPRMGSVTYRTLCLAPTLVLALPPQTP